MLSDCSSFEFEDEIDVGKLMTIAGSEVLCDDESTIDFSVNIDGSVAPISCDRDRVLRIGRGLIGEAKKNLIDDEGKIEIKVSNARIGSDDREAVRIQCIDNGMPVPEEERGQMFDPFFIRSNRPADFGVELLYAYLSVFYHGGSIRALLNDNEENVIEIILPRIPISPEVLGTRAVAPVIL